MFCLVVSHSVPGTLKPIFESIFYIIYHYLFLLNKHLMNILT